jgi:hypothetical protein
MCKFLVEVVDPMGVPLDGTNIHFEINGSKVGSVFSSQGNASIEIADQDVVITIFVDHDFETQVASVPASIGSHRFVFDNASRALTKGPPSARCPDGTTGQPCVNCSIGGSAVRICG